MKKILVMVAVALVSIVANAFGPCGPCPRGPGGIAPWHRPCPPPHCPGGWGGPGFWGGFIGGCVAGAAIRCGGYGYGYPTVVAPAVATAPTVVYSGNAAYGYGITPPITYATTVPATTVVTTSPYVAPAATVVTTAPAVAPVVTTTAVAPTVPVTTTTTIVRPREPLIGVNVLGIRAGIGL